MPIYEYRCSSCGHELEALQKLSDARLSICPSCGAAALVKQLSAAGFQLKGSGWYATDFKSSGSKPEAKTDGDSKGETSGATATDDKGTAKSESKAETRGDSKSESKGESKPESKGESKPESKGASKSESKGESSAPAKGTGAPSASS